MATVEKPEARFERPTWWWYTRIGIGLAVVVILLWLLLGFLWYAFSPVSEAGTFGDSFGMVNALFSGLAFAGVVLAIIIQVVELRVTWEEIEDSRIAQQQTAQQQYGAAMMSGIAALQALDEKRAKSFKQLLEQPTLLVLLISEYKNRMLLGAFVDHLVANPPDDSIKRIQVDPDLQDEVAANVTLCNELVEIADLAWRTRVALQALMHNGVDDKEQHWKVGIIGRVNQIDSKLASFCSKYEEVAVEETGELDLFREFCATNNLFDADPFHGRRTSDEHSAGNISHWTDHMLRLIVRSLMTRLNLVES